MSKERSVWVGVLRRYQQVLPLPPKAYLGADSSYNRWSTDDLRSLALRSWRLKACWTKPRKQIHRIMTDTSSSPSATLLGMQMVLDRWLLLVYGAGAMQLFDTQGDPRRVAHLGCGAPQGSQWSSFVAGVDNAGNTPLVAVVRCVPCVRSSACLTSSTHQCLPQTLSTDYMVCRLERVRE